MNLNRREFIRKNAITGLGLVIAPSILHAGFQPAEKVRLGFIGMGGRGSWLMNLALQRDDVLIKAVCDIKEEAVKEAQKTVEEAGSKNLKGTLMGSMPS